MSNDTRDGAAAIRRALDVEYKRGFRDGQKEERRLFKLTKWRPIMGKKSRRCSTCGVDPAESTRVVVEEAMHPLHRRIDTLFRMLFLILFKEVKMSQAVDALVAEVTEVKGVQESAKALIEKAVVLLEGAISTGDMQAVIEATNALKASTDPLAAAVAAGAPVIDPPPPGQ